MSPWIFAWMMLVSEPSGADVGHDGVRIGTTNMKLAGTPGRPFRLTIWKAGYRSQAVDILPLPGLVVRVKLVRAAQVPAPRRRGVRKAVIRTSPTMKPYVVKHPHVEG